MTRCEWANQDPMYRDYHDKEWGVPVYDDHRLFEMLILEGMQAGLSWITILRKRENFRKAFDDFDVRKIAAYNNHKIKELLQNPGIIRNELKIRAAITNAQIFLRIQESYGSFSQYVWYLVGDTPRINAWKKLAEIPARTAESDYLSKQLKKQGFTFTGSTICYSFMQAIGMVNDHLIDCFRYNEINSIIHSQNFKK